MERITTAATNAIYAGLLFFFLFSACSKTTHVSNFRQKEIYARYSVDLEQGHEVRPVTSYIAPLMSREEIPFKDTMERKTVLEKKTLPNTKQQLKYLRADTVQFIKESPSFQPIDQTEATTTTEHSALKWFRMLA